MQTWTYYTIPILLVLVLPIVLKINIYIDSKSKKAYFSFYLIKVFRLYGGYAALYDEGIVFHLTKNKAVLLPYNEILSARNRFEITKGFAIRSYRQIIEIGGRNHTAAAIMIGALIQMISDGIFSVLHTKYPATDLTTNILLFPEREGVKATLGAVAVFNIAVVLLAGIKIILEKCIEYGRKRKKASR